MVLAKIDIEKTAKVIVLGSVVYTEKANYFLAISAGEIQAKGTLFYVISPLSPIGKLLLGKTVGDIVVFGDQQLKIKAVI